MRRQRHGRSNRAGAMCEADVSPFLEVQVVEEEDHAGKPHTNRGENMRGGRSGQAEATFLGGWRSKQK